MIPQCRFTHHAFRLVAFVMPSMHHLETIYILLLYGNDFFVTASRLEREFKKQNGRGERIEGGIEGRPTLHGMCLNRVRAMGAAISLGGGNVEGKE